MRHLKAALCCLATRLSLVSAIRGPFLEQLDNSTWTFGNDLWNITQGAVYASKLYFNGTELVGPATGHYMGYDGENNFVWTSATITSQSEDHIDVSFSSKEGELHWVVFEGVAGAYQYFVNRALPNISILRTLWRLDPTLFLNGRTYLRDEPLPDFSLYQSATKIQDETWQKPDGTFITKYDFADYVRERDFYGLYGPRFGSWYIHAGQDYYNSDHLSQTLTVHRESATGDSVQLNVVQDTSHFRVGEKVAQPSGKIWGPWLWYLNNGSVADAQSRAAAEGAKWPYPWLRDPAFQERGDVTGVLRLTDGRPAAGAAVFLGDAATTRRPLVQGRGYYYTTRADATGRFALAHVRAGTYGLVATADGGALGDVYTNASYDGVVVVEAGRSTQLPPPLWAVPDPSKRLFTIGDCDKKALGFRNGGPPSRHGAAEQSPANLTFTVGTSEVSDWFYAQALLGTWTVEFELEPQDLSPGTASDEVAVLSLSLAGYSQSAAMDVAVNGRLLGSLSKDTLANDPSVYRSGKTSGEWRFVQYGIPREALRAGANTLTFTVTRYTQWRGFMWDCIAFECV